jgi:heme-degrading monooxygenase HmoA
MYNRVTTLSDVKDIGAFVAGMQETALAALRARRGYQGLSISADRSNGVVGTLTMWETEADRDASDSALSKLRDDARAQFASDMKVETFDERVVESGRRPEVGSALMVTRVRMDPARVDENLEHFKREVLPQIKATPGFRTLRSMFNPQTGHGLVGSIWDDEQSTRAAAETAMARRADATARGIDFGEPSYRKILPFDI